MQKKKYSKEFLKILESVKAKRPRTVIQHILKHGQITTQDLKDLYGYNHPPRAIRDVKENGIPITRFGVKGTDGRSIAAYKFGDPIISSSVLLYGRTAFSKEIKSRLIQQHGSKCNIYNEEFPERELQIDHRIPFEISGNSQIDASISNYMLLCGSANRSKSWSCENCPNWKEKKIQVCQKCYWAFPEKYDHVATRPIRRLDLMWVSEEVPDYNALKKEADNQKVSTTSLLKNIVKRHVLKT